MVARTIGSLFLLSVLIGSASGQKAPPAMISCWATAVQEYRPTLVTHAKHPLHMPVIHENEPSNERLRNDTPQSAEHLADFGPSGLNAVEIQGVLAMPEPVALELASEEGSDDGSITLARAIQLSPGTRARVEAFIGDGFHGSRGSQTGDYDFYGLGFLTPGQVVTIDITTEPVEPRLDTKVALYNRSGQRLEQNDDGIFGERDSYLETVIAEPDSYFVIVRGINSDWPSDPFDPTSGPKVGSEGPYTLTLGLDATDMDWYSMDLSAGDVISASLNNEALRVRFADVHGDILMNSDLDRSSALPDTSPLLRGGNANLAHVAPHSGRYAISAATGSGEYSLQLAVFRPGLQEAGASQVLFIDFDGAEYDAEYLGGHPNAQLSPMADFLALQQLADQESAIIDIALDVVKENLIDDLEQGFSSQPALQIMNSRDHADPWGAPNVSRIIVGGSQQELGLSTVGIAESIDVGNFKHNETAVVLLDIVTNPLVEGSFARVERAPHVSMVDLLGLALGNIIAHEAGHLFASFHTGHPDHPVQLMAGGPDAAAFLGAGADRILGTSDDRDVDLGRSPYKKQEGFIGFQDTRSAVGFGLLAGQPSTIALKSNMDLGVGMIHPNPSSDEVWLPLMHGMHDAIHLEVFDMLGRIGYRARVRSGGESVRIPVSHLPAGLYAVRLAGANRMITRHFAVVR